MAKKIPILGIGVGAVFAVERWCNGEIGKGFAELASGAVSSIPGYGTAASIGIDAALAASDVYEAVQEEEEGKILTIYSTFSPGERGRREKDPKGIGRS